MSCWRASAKTLHPPTICLNKTSLGPSHHQKGVELEWSHDVQNFVVILTTALAKAGRFLAVEYRPWQPPPLSRSAANCGWTPLGQAARKTQEKR
jgi:hypothetical protein